MHVSMVRTWKAAGLILRSQSIPGHLWTGDKFELNPYIRVTPRTPPTFLLQAEDDDVDGVSQSLVYYLALKNARVPVEMHLYAQGGHALGCGLRSFR